MDAVRVPSASPKNIGKSFSLNRTFSNSSPNRCGVSALSAPHGRCLLIYIRQSPLLSLRSCPRLLWPLRHNHKRGRCENLLLSPLQKMGGRNTNIDGTARGSFCGFFFPLLFCKRIYFGFRVFCRASLSYNYRENKEVYGTLRGKTGSDIVRLKA